MRTRCFSEPTVGMTPCLANACNPTGDMLLQGEPIKAANVMGGDVYFCAGQSNMVFPIKYAYNPVQEMVRIVSRSIPPPWGSVRFGLAPRAYAPWHVRVVG